jgi:hypothetical protein
MGPIGCPEATVNYQYLLRNDSEERSVQRLRPGKPEITQGVTLIEYFY